MCLRPRLPRPPTACMVWLLVGQLVVPPKGWVATLSFLSGVTNPGSAAQKWEECRGHIGHRDGGRREREGKESWGMPRGEGKRWGQKTQRQIGTEVEGEGRGEGGKEEGPGGSREQVPMALLAAAF